LLWGGAQPAEVILHSLADAVLTTDHAGRVSFLNRAAEKMTGWSRSSAVGRPVGDVLDVRHCATAGRTPRSEFGWCFPQHRVAEPVSSGVLIGRDGRIRPVETSTAPILEPGGETTGTVFVIRDVGAAMETCRQMSHLAQHDPLTGLPNRLLLIDRITQAIALNRRRCMLLAVFYLDVDGFKQINDSMGHAGGDQVLRSLATRLKRSLRPSDTVCRVGGDEFVIEVSELERASDAALVATKLLLAVAGPHPLEDREARITASIGVAVCPDHGDDADSLIRRADAAMYEVKRAGRGGYRLCS
jgi:diguanylate cyclase (GGDEF)-like protein/PAS domain S-box-containing protein